MIRVMFVKTVHAGMFKSLSDLRVFKMLDVPIIQPGLRVAQGDFWEAQVKDVYVRDGEVFASCESEDTRPRYSWGQDRQMTLLLNKGWFDNKADARAEYTKLRNAELQKMCSAAGCPFFPWSYSVGIREIGNAISVGAISPDVARELESRGGTTSLRVDSRSDS